MPMASVGLKAVLEKSWSGKRLTTENLKYLLSMNERDPLARYVRDSASMLTRLWSENSAAILGSIGIETKPCPAACRFCSFGAGHTAFKPHRMPQKQLKEKIRTFTRDEDLYALILVTMHNFDHDHLLKMAELSLREIPHGTTLWLNIGDSDAGFLRECYELGVRGVYHAIRLREGIDTRLDPADRIRTIENAKKAGLKVMSCLEPIGPEHTVDELAEHIQTAIDLGVDIYAAMARVGVPGTPLAAAGSISPKRLAHITACTALAYCGPGHPFLSAHEPTVASFKSGASVIMAEAGSNPRDENAETDGSDGGDGRGLTVSECRDLLYKAGFRTLRNGHMKKLPLRHS